jgi:hypothetical protein
MSIEALIFFWVGALLETGLLWSQAKRGGFSRLVAQFVTPKFSVYAALVLVIGMLGYLAARLSGVLALKVSLDDGWVMGMFVILALFLLAAGVIGDGLLPRVNERSILTVQVLVLLLALMEFRQTDWLWLGLLVGIPLAGSLVLLFTRQSLGAPLKACVYLGYLFALLYLSYQTASWAVFSAAELSGVAGLAFGSLCVFLGLHSLFALRFFLIVSSLILPRNRPAIGPMMRRLFSDEQVPPWRFGLFALAAAALLAANAFARVLSTPVLISLLVLLSSQLAATHE